MLRENRSETEELHRRIAAKDSELATDRNVCKSFFFDSSYEVLFCSSSSQFFLGRDEAIHSL